MVRSLRAGLDQYQDPYVQAQIKKMLAQKAPSNRVQGMGHILKQGLAGFMMGEDDNQRTAAQEAYATGINTPYSPAVAYKPKVVDPGVSELDIEMNPEEYDGIRAAGVLDSPGVEAKEEDGPFIAAQRGLSELKGNRYASGLLADMGMQQASADRAARIAAGVRDEGRTYAESVADKQHQRAVELAQNKPRAPKTVNTATGIHILNPDGSLGKRIGAIPPGRGTQPLTPERFKQNKQLHTMRVNTAAAAKIATEAELKRIKPLPASVVKKQDDLLEQADIADNIDEDLGTIQTQLTDGSLELGPLKNKAYELKNWTGYSDAESTLYSNMRTKLEKLRNDSLRLNTGVQTDGDATRAWDEILANMNDTNIVKTRLAEIRRLNQRAKEELYFRVTTIRNEYGKNPLRRKKQGDIPVGWTEVK
jgi:hypothetical protein